MSDKVNEREAMAESNRHMLDHAFRDADNWRRAVELAYGLLWSDPNKPNWYKRRAQKVLLAALEEGYDGNPRPGQKAGIEAARELMKAEGVWDAYQAELERSIMVFDPRPPAGGREY